MRPGTVVRHRAIDTAVRGLAGSAPVVLDVGGNDGSTATSFPEVGGRLVVLDLDSVGLGAARAGGLAAVRGSATAIPLASGSVGLALCCDVLPCLSDDDTGRVYPEIARVLAAGGHLVVTEVDERFKLPFVANEVAFRRWAARLGGFSYSQLASLLDDAGFTVVEHRMFYGVLTRAAYTVLFFWWPRRGTRVKQWLWRRTAGLERRWCPWPRAHVIVAVAGVAAPHGSGSGAAPVTRAGVG